MKLQKPPLEIKYSARALADLKEIVAYISKDSRDAALSMHDRIMERVSVLAEFPGRGKPVDEPAHRERGVRYAAEGKYYIFYHADAGQLKIIHVRHSARKPVTARELFDSEE